MEALMVEAGTVGATRFVLRTTNMSKVSRCLAAILAATPSPVASLINSSSKVQEFDTFTIGTIVVVVVDGVVVAVVVFVVVGGDGGTVVGGGTCMLVVVVVVRDQLKDGDKAASDPEPSKTAMDPLKVRDVVRVAITSFIEESVILPRMTALAPLSVTVGVDGTRCIVTDFVDVVCWGGRGDSVVVKG